MRFVFATFAAACASVALSGLPAAGAAPTGCHALLTAQDARAIALRLPNARAFAENEHATLTTALVQRPANGAQRVRVVATQPGAEPVDVGVYAVNLRTGAVLDDDQEPADDSVTQAETARLLARRCGLVR